MTLKRTLHGMTRADLANFGDWQVFARADGCDVFAKATITSLRTGKPAERTVIIHHRVSEHDAPLQQWRAKFSLPYQENRARYASPDDAMSMGMLAEIVLEGLKFTTDADLAARRTGDDTTTVQDLRERMNAFL